MGTDYKTEGKAPLQKIDPEFVEEMARVQEIGDQKHADHHWRDGVSMSAVVGAVKRHVAEIEKGNYLDPETNRPHAAHAACGLMYIAYYQRNHPKYAEFFDLLYQGPAKTGSDVGRSRVSPTESEWLLNQALGGDSGTVRGPEPGGTSGCDAIGPGLISPDWRGSGQGAGGQDENQ